MTKQTRRGRTKSGSTEQALRDADYAGQIEAINRSQCVIEFQTDGTILSANDNFLSMMGYELDEIVGKHHSMFAEPEFAAHNDYKAFWDALGRGEYQAAEFKRLGKNGREVWIQASYNPIFDDQGKPYKVVKFATDVTERKMTEAMIASQAVVEFAVDGTILAANEKFLSMMGYELDEIVGKHHGIFRRSRFSERSAMNTKLSGRLLGAAKVRQPNSSGLARTARRFGCKPPTRPSLTVRASPTRS